nr:EOG090X0GLS [Triops cancriformis]
MGDTFRAKDIGLKVQKKLLSRVSTKGVAKVFIDETSANLLDNVYRLCKAYAQNRKEAEKIAKNIIKIVVKVGILAKNDQFTSEDLKIADQFRNKFHSTAMTVISFHEVDFSYDQKFILQLVADCRSLLKQLVQRHLTDKSLGRIDLVFSFFGQPAFLDAIFRRPSEHHELMGRIVQDMHTLLDAGDM